MRQQGVRLVLAPLTGATGLATFATMRTGANVALQGLNTIINPLLPDLMRFLHDRDQKRSEAAFATIWIVVIVLLAPGVVILQVFIQPFFIFWTQGKISFDPLLFALLSLGVLIYAIVQPAMAVVIGNNLTRLQLALAAMAAAVLFALLFILVPAVGILGAAIALLAAEIAAAVGYKISAVRWLKQNNLAWPDRAFGHALIAVSIAAAALTTVVVVPEYNWLILVVSLLCFGLNARRYWLILPSIALESARTIGVRVQGFLFLSKKTRVEKKALSAQTQQMSPTNYIIRDVNQF
jgi:O-antigen/teichoic acid export membrane protein